MGERNKKRRQITYIAIIVLIIIIVAIVMAYNLDVDAIVETLLTGIVSSILASIMFYVFSKYVFQDNSEEKEKLEKDIERLNEIYGFAVNNNMGILKIEKRSSYNYDFWKNFLKSTENTCIISGRTLNRWLEKQIRQEFADTLKNLIQNDGKITFVIYKNPEDEGEKEEKEEFKEFLEEEIFPYLYKKEKPFLHKHRKKSKCIKIYEVDILHYLYTANDNMVVVAPYFQYTENIENIMFSLDVNSIFGKMYSKDFKAIMKNKAEANQWYEKYCESREKG